MGRCSVNCIPSVGLTEARPSFAEERFAAEVRRLYQVLTDSWTIVNASWKPIALTN